MEGTKIRLFRQKNKHGKVYLTGAVSELTRLIVIENDRKQDDHDPDYYAYMVPNRGGSHAPSVADDL